MSAAFEPRFLRVEFAFAWPACCRPSGRLSAAAWCPCV
jgi:hypothetical protein